MNRVALVDEIAAVRAVCEKLGFGEVTPTVLKKAHHTTLLIDPLSMVARVQSAESLAEAQRRATQELAVTRHLARRNAPVIVPLADEWAGPYVVGSSIVTLWPFVQHGRTADDTDGLLAAATLAFVHENLLGYAGELPPYTQALDRCWCVIADDEASGALSRDDRELLKMQYRRLRHEVEAMADAPVPLHGDAHLGNLLISPRGPLWTDFEDACLGPREIDIAGLPASAWPYFPDADQILVERCADLKSVCVAIWCWVDVSRSAEIREAAEHHLRRVQGLAL